MNPTPTGQVLLPKSDKRFKPGNIAKDKHGRLRGHPDTVELRRLEGPNMPIEYRLNPPLVISHELAEKLKGSL